MSGKIDSRAADNIRALTVAMVEKARSGHPGGAMGGADFIHILYTEYLNFDPTDLSWPNRDRFYLDPGHMSPMLYSVLALYGIFSIDELKNFRQWGSTTPGHPERDIKRGIENTSGPLGQGHAMALGAAIAERFFAARFGEWTSHKIYAYISDGGIQEEISQGVGRLAGHLGLSNLIMFYDSNDIQLSTPVDEVTSEDTALKYQAWGWNVIAIDGNDHDQIRSALTRANEEKERPTLIIGKTIMGKGALAPDGSNFERQVSTHGMPLSDAGGSVEKTIRNLGGDPENPFAIYPDVAEYYRKISEKKAVSAAQKKAEQKRWEEKNPELSAKWRKFWSGEIPEIDWASIQQKPGQATRTASGNVLGVFGETVENMIVSSADLCNSDKTEGFLKKSKILKKGDFSGGFLQAGVAELTMASVMNGMAAHGGIIPVCATFFAFSDYMKPAIRLAALMNLPVKYVFTHDTFRVGEDGPTHQPIEQETQLRLLEKMANLEGKRSMLVIRPADSAETTVSWKMAMEFEGPCALILTRQNVADLPPKPGSKSRFDDALGACRGAYIVADCDGQPDLILVGNGAEVATLIEGAKRLTDERGLKVRVVSAPSEGAFFDQDPEYRQEVIPCGIPVMGLTAGLPVAIQGLVGPLGKVIGMERFGASAPYKVLDEKFGYNAENVVRQAEIFLKEYEKMVSSITSRETCRGLAK
ncbi:MAG TPA: transketolase [Chitinispirillaceae bacterium]|nr:transketolase [Chitinispirillaceae bacterium]